MPTFVYTARDRAGVLQTGQLEAVSDDDILPRLNQLQVFRQAVFHFPDRNFHWMLST